MLIATMKTMTLAMRGKNALDARGIQTEIVSLDPSLTQRGCAYGLRFSAQMREEALRALTEKKIPWGTILGGGGI